MEMSEIIPFLFLIPGIIAAVIFYYFTSLSKPNPFEFIILALIFATIGILIIESGLQVYEFSLFKEDYIFLHKFLLLTGISIFIGLCGAWSINADIPNLWLRKIGLTRNTSYPSEWYSAFIRFSDDAYVVLHLRDGRRLYGHAHEWPDHPDQGHFIMTHNEWLLEEGDPIKLDHVSAILIPVKDVNIVEFVEAIDTKINR